MLSMLFDQAKNGSGGHDEPNIHGLDKSLQIVISQLQKHGQQLKTTRDGARLY